jgi:hypothetical protein
VDRRTILKIKVDLREVGWEDTNWTCLVQDWNCQQALVNTIIPASRCKNHIYIYISRVPQEYFYNVATGSILLHIKQHVLATQATFTACDQNLNLSPRS